MCCISMNEHQQILWRNVRCPTVSKLASSVNRWHHECMVLVTSVSQSFVGLCTGFWTVIFACNEAIFHFKPVVLLVNRCVTPLQASQILTTALRIRFQQLSHSFYHKEGRKRMLSFFPTFPRFSLHTPVLCLWIIWPMNWSSEPAPLCF